MSDDSTTSDGVNDSYIFVTLLSKYKVILERLKTPEMNKKKNDAALAMAEEFSQKCGRKLTIRQVFKKVHGFKHRLKDKNYKNMSRRKQMPFLKWERMFLELWVGNGITEPSNRPHRIRPQGKKTSKYKTPEDIIRNFEAEYNLLEDDTHTSSDNSTHNYEPEVEASLKTANDEKRAALISQINILKAQEEVARKEEKFHLYKLSLLQNKVEDNKK